MNRWNWPKGWEKDVLPVLSMAYFVLSCGMAVRFACRNMSSMMRSISLWSICTGSIGGAILIGMLSNIMNNLAVNQFYQYVLKGALLVLAMVVYSVSHMLEVKRHGE